MGGNSNWRSASDPCITGNDVWIGAGASILRGVTIGDGAVIGASSVVTKDVPPYAIIVGNPGRILRMRVPEAFIDRLEKLAWWDFPPYLIKEHFDLFSATLNETILEQMEQLKIEYTKFL